MILNSKVTVIEIKKSKYWFSISVDSSDWYLFQLNVLLKPDFK